MSHSSTTRADTVSRSRAEESWPVSSKVLVEAKALGLLGPSPLELHTRHSIGFAYALRRVWAEGDGPGGDEGARFPSDLESEEFQGDGIRILDLGSGGGVPGIVIAELWPSASITLLEGAERRGRLLQRWVDEAGWEQRVAVLPGRAEDLGRVESLRGAFDAVVARLFGAPSVTAECAAPFLKLGALLVVSDPPDDDPGPGVIPGESSETSDKEPSGSRWPPEGLATLGLERAAVIRSPFHFTVLRQTSRCPARYPRRTGVPAKRPIF